jgi:CBS domain-containing protein
MAAIVHQIIPDTQTTETLVTVTEPQSLQDALSLMIEHDFSQLPVVDQEFKLRGLISSDSILKAVSYFQSGLDNIRVSHVMFVPKTCRSDDDITELLSLLGESSAVLVVGKENELIGILTGYDTTEYYRQRAEDIMLVEEIEMLIRDYIQYAYGDEAELSEQIKKISSGGEIKSKVRATIQNYLNKIEKTGGFDSVVFEDAYGQCFQIGKSECKKIEDLTLSECIQILGTIWNGYLSLAHDLEWKSIYCLLDEVRKIRNSIAHFREIIPNDRKKLEFCLKLLERYRPVPETEGQPDSIVQDTESIGEGTSVHSELGYLNAPPDEEIDEDIGSYALLSLYLQKEVSPNEHFHRVSFAKVEDTIQDTLPASALKHRTWWSNDGVAQLHSQSWLDAGWRVSNVNIANQTVSFTRLAEREASYINFFSSLLPKLESIHGLKIEPATNNQGRHWFVIKVTSSEIDDPVLLVISFARKSRLRIELYIDLGDLEKNKRVFDFIYEHKTEVEKKFNDSLTWERLDKRRASRIAVYRSQINILLDMPNLQEAEDWVVQTIERFYRSITPRFLEASLKVAEVHDSPQAIGCASIELEVTNPLPDSVIPC